MGRATGFLDAVGEAWCLSAAARAIAVALFVVGFVLLMYWLGAVWPR